jgi:hypothetical protein
VHSLAAFAERMLTLLTTVCRKPTQAKSILQLDELKHMKRVLRRSVTHHYPRGRSFCQLARHPLATPA